MKTINNTTDKPERLKTHGRASTFNVNSACGKYVLAVGFGTRGEAMSYGLARGLNFKVEEEKQ